VARLQWYITAAAASIAFVIGWAGGAKTALLEPQPQLERPLESVTELGDRYARALALTPPIDDSARIAAVATFRAVADQVVRLGVDDMDLKVALRYALRASATQMTNSNKPTAVWF
jgi:hypothetical protein